MTVKDLLDTKGIRQLSPVHVTREEVAIGASKVRMDMIGTFLVPECAHFAKVVPNSHFQFGMPWSKHANATEALHDAMAALTRCGLKQITWKLDQSLKVKRDWITSKTIFCLIGSHHCISLREPRDWAHRMLS